MHWARVRKGKYVIFVLSRPLRLARERYEVCRLDSQLIREMLGIDPVQVTRIANGDENCTYHVSQIIEPAVHN